MPPFLSSNLTKVAVVLIAVALAYGYFRYSQNRIERLSAELATSRQTIAIQQQTIRQIEADARENAVRENN